MDIAIPLNGNAELTNQERDELKKIRNDVKDIKLDMLRTILINEGIEFNSRITNFKELEKDLNKNLSKAQKNKINYQLQKGQKEILDIISTIDESSSTTLQKFLKQANTQVITPAARVALLGMTSRVVYTVLTTLPTTARTITGITGVVGVAYKGTKIALAIKRKKESKRYDKILEKLAMTKDSEGNIVDTRFKDGETEVIKNYLSKIGRKIERIDSLEISREVQKLNNSQKLEIINMINHYKGDPIDINQELKQERKQEKINALKTIIGGIGIGAAAATAVNSVDETLIAGPVNGFLTKGVITNFIDNTHIQNILGMIGGIGTKALTYIPVVGEELKNIFATESIIIGASAGAVASLGIVGAKVVYRATYLATKGTYEKVKAFYQSKKYKDTDKKIYEDIDKKKELTDKQKLMLGVVKVYMQEKGMEFSQNIQSNEELKEAVKQLNNSDKKELKRIMSVCEEEITKDEQLSQRAKQVLSLLENSLIIGATGIAINDAKETVTSFVDEKLEAMDDKLEGIKRAGGTAGDLMKEIEDILEGARKKGADKKAKFLVNDQETPEIEIYE